MKPNVINLSALLVLLIAGLVVAIFSMRSNEKEEDRAALNQDHVAKEDKLKEQEKEPEESALNSQEVAQDTRANAHMRPPEDPSVRALEQEIQKTDNSPASEALQQHVVALYGDLFKELKLPAEQQQKYLGWLDMVARLHRGAARARGRLSGPEPSGDRHRGRTQRRPAHDGRLL